MYIINLLCWTGLPWELGVAETHQTLTLNNLRSRVVLQVIGVFFVNFEIQIYYVPYDTYIMLYALVCPFFTRFFFYRVQKATFLIEPLLIYLLKTSIDVLTLLNT